uniref:Major facilitator superfamily domain-containing protein 8 n=2 Tax=Ascaris TaxID=6251 RepID=F1L0I9_ASCSU
MKVSAEKASKNTLEEFEKRRTPWKSIWLSYLIQTLTGIQFSIFFTSMWPYFTTLDEDADLHFFGWITAAYSLGQIIASWVFGFWNQKTMSTTQPACCGLAFMALGNILYAILPQLPIHHKWLMLFARLLVGFGSGNLTVLRTYCAMASVQKDRAKAMSLAVGSFVLGLSIGPAIQSIFTPIGKEGFVALSLLFNMYTVPAMLMVFVSLLSIVLLVFLFEENYAGVISDTDKADPFIVVPKYDRMAAITCIYLWFMLQSIATNVEVTMTPFAIALYNWNNETAVLYNGILQCIGCSIDIMNYLLISYTRIGRLDKRKMMLFSLSCFIFYHVFTLPWPFFDGPLDYIELGGNTSTEDTSISGGCFRRYQWCAYTTRVPLPIYIFCFVFIFGFAFPYLAGPLGTVFSEILGPRKQGMMQGIFEFGGCVARCVAPIILTALFEKSGYLWPTVIHLGMSFFGLALLIVFYRRIVPLKLKPKVGVPTPYKSGTFYHL